MDAYRLDQARNPNERTITSAADATAVFDSAFYVPKGKVWTFQYISYMPSVAETRDITLTIYNIYTLNTHCAKWQGAYNSLVGQFGFLTEGRELKLYPGDRITVNRSAATAGSTMTLICRFIETDLPSTKHVDVYRHWSEAVRAGIPAPAAPDSPASGPGMGEGSPYAPPY